MTDLSLTFADLYKEVSNFLGLGLSPSGDKLALAKKYANDGYRLFLMGVDPRSQRAYQWSFLAPAASLDLWASVAADEGVTVTGVYASGTTTLTATGGAPFHPSMVGRTIAITGMGSFPISGYTSAGVIAVKGNAACTSKTFSIAADGSYGLPAGFAAIIDDPCPAGAAQGFAGSGAAPLAGGALRPRSAAYIRQLYAGGGIQTGTPQYYAVVPRAFAASEGQRYDMLVWPAPVASITVCYRYRVEPDALSADGDLPLGGPQHALTILQAALAVAEQRHNDARGIHTEQFERLMAFSIDLDAANKPHNLGDSGGGPPPDVLGRRGRVEYP
jgi:hypothetical protein